MAADRIIHDGGLYFLADSSGNKISKKGYEEMYFAAGILIAKSNGLYGLLDGKGNSVTGFRFTSGERLSDGLVVVCEEGKYYVIDGEGHEVSATKYDNWNYCFNRYSIVSIHDKYGTVSNDGRAVIPPVYDGLEFYLDDIVFADNGGKKVILTSRGRLLDTVSSREEAVSFVEKTYAQIMEEESAYWDSILDRYEILCRHCSDPKQDVSSLLEEAKQIKDELTLAEGSMNQKQLLRLFSITDDYYSLYDAK